MSRLLGKIIGESPHSTYMNLVCWIVALTGLCSVDKTEELVDRIPEGLHRTRDEIIGL